MSVRPTKRRVAFLALLTAVASVVTVVDMTTSAAASGSSCGANVNPIACENQQPGTPDDVWDVTGAGDSTIQGFATDISVNVGNTVSFKVSTDASAYKIDIYRLGWYGGNGARKVTTVNPSATLPQTQPACASNPSTGLVDCGTWAVSASWAVPSTAVSGVYIADLIRTDTGGKSQIPFIVRNDASTSDIVYQTSDPTWEAYNRYGGSDFYTGTAGNLYDSGSRARQISYNRPFATRADSAGRDYLFSNEYPTIRFLERNGYDVSYIAGVDTDRYGSTLLTKHSTFLSVGHDEYWSQAQRTNVEKARDAGVNLMFLSGNEIFWHTRYAASIDGSNTAYRTLVCYKETWDNSATDPTGEATATWRDPRFSAAPGGSNPENALSGTMYMSNATDLPLTVTAAQGKLRVWRNTGLSSMTGSSTDVGQHIVGYESDEDVDNGFRNAGQVDLSTTTGPTTQYLADFGQVSTAGTTTHHMTLYRAASGALVFGAGTIQWGWGLDSDHDGSATPASPQMQQFMINMLADMHAQPQTLMSGLVAASAGTDTTAPTSTVTSPTSGQTVANGAQVTVTGTASDVGGSVAGVEVSIDGGTTWHEAIGTTSWSYTGFVYGNGAVQILSRATDDSMNTESPGAGASITVSCPCTLFGASTPSMVDSGDAGSTTLGVRFSTTSAGYVTGIRFYKAATNTGTHTGSLYTAGGSLLATGTFTNETASGWQTLQFANPVAIGANTTYVASYWAPSGHYSESDRFFYYRTYQANPLRAQANSPTDASKKNGLYSAGNSFPTKTYLGANYYVDPTFVPAANGIPSVASTTPDADATGVDPSVTPSATFTAAMDPTSLTFTLTGPTGTVDGSIGYNASTRTATFTPTNPLAAGTTYQASVSGTGTNGTAMIVPNTWSFKTAGAAACPCTLFPTASEPGVPDSGDSSKISVGTTFTPSVSGYVTGARFYKSAANTGVHTASLWSTDGTRLATSTYGNESATGWQLVSFSPAVAVTAGTTYVISYYAPKGHYAEDDHYFDAGLVNGPLSAPVGAGVYAYGVDQFPSSAYANANYWVDPVFDTQPSSPAPTVTSSTPAAGATGVDPGTSVTATFSVPVKPRSVSFALSSAGGQVAGTTSYDATTNVATFTPSAPLTSSTTFTAQVSAVGTNGVTMTAPASWSFTSLSSCPCSLFPSSATPVTVDGADRSAVTLGVKFSASEPGTITGVKFYKASSNTGTHVGALWAADGTMLASATFTDESDSGWQSVTFASPVTIAAGTTYVASYTAPNGHYSEDANYFAGPLSSGPLTAPAGASVYAIGTSAFPSSSYANANYWVDVVFASSAGGTGGGGGGTTSPTAPSVTSTTPASAATGVSRSATPRAVFSAPVQSSSVVFTLSGPGGAVSGTTVYDGNAQTATFTPDSPLSYSTTYTASVLATGANGMTMSTPTTWSYTTAAPPPVTVTNTSPAAGATGVARSATAGATFSVPAQPSSITFTLTSAAGNVAGSVAYDSAAQTATFTPSSALAYSTSYTASVSATGSNGATMVSPTSWTFTTAAPPPPTVTTTSPAAAATGVSRSATPKATFSAPVQAASISFTMTSASGNVAGTVAYDSASQTATFTPSATLAYNTTYTASVSATGTNGTAMPSPTSWSFTTLADTTPPVISAVSATTVGGGFSVTWTTDEASSSRVDYGTSATSLTSTASASGNVTSHAVTITGIAANTRYYYRVTSVDPSGNSSTSPATGSAAATWAPTIAAFVDTSTTDFGAGTNSSTYVASNGDGEVVLNPSYIAEFAGTTVPTTLATTATVTGGKTTVNNGVATVSGARLRTNTSYNNGRSLDARATLLPGHSIGFISTSSTSVQMSFSVNSSQQLIATVNDGFANVASRVVATSWTPAMHVYSIRWTSSNVTFLVDDTQVFTNGFSTLFGTTYKPQFADPVTSDAGLVIDWMRMAPYAASGTFTSRVFDASAAVTWGALSWDSTVPSGTALTVQVRTGPTATPGTGWTAWTTVASSGASVATTSRYLQYRLLPSTTGSLFATPTVRSVSVAARV